MKFSLLQSHANFDESEQISYAHVAVVFGFSITLSLMLALWPRAGEQVVALFPPWVHPGHAMDQVDAAGGAVVDVVAGGHGMVVVSDTKHINRALLDHGAWMVVNGSALRGLCAKFFDKEVYDAVNS